MPVFKEKLMSLGQAELESPYAQLLQEDAESSRSTEDGARVSHKLSAKLVVWLTILNGLLLVASLFCLGLTFVVHHQCQCRGESGILRQTTFYSPPIDSLSPKWGLQEFITAPIMSNESILRQDPSPAVDAAWDRVADLAVIPLTRNQILKLGKSPSSVLRAPASWGVGDDMYLGQMDGVHLLHCLNAMRKSLHYNFAHYYPQGHSAAYRAHLAHCQEALAQWLMCQPSLELITFNWVDKHEMPFPDFDITRKCWDFERLLAWQDENRVQSVNSATWKALRKPADAVAKPSPLLNDETLDHVWPVMDGCRQVGEAGSVPPR